eukprot:TRINITY_DN715_c0_g4_i1.p1 TRINITY_DN715_c0_g4~~TRINITY_DN715_c0_g4_i1.p1  ORF type:complete len:103 (+),score=11.09 TRINITY_DN715_c0_g4_i1:163-471(+)
MENKRGKKGGTQVLRLFFPLFIYSFPPPPPSPLIAGFFFLFFLGVVFLWTPLVSNFHTILFLPPPISFFEFNPNKENKGKEVFFFGGKKKEKEKEDTKRRKN